MRVAQIARPWLPVPPTGYGGIELVVDVLARMLQARGHDVTLFAPSGSSSTATVTPTMPPTGAARIGDGLAEAHHVRLAYAHAREFDVIHDHTDLGPVLGMSLGACPPVVHTLHGPWTSDTKRYYGMLDPSPNLVAISRTQRLANAGVSYAATIPNGIDLATYPLWTGPREDYLVFIGRAAADKGVDLALELAHRVGLPLKLVVKRSDRDEHIYWEREIEPLLHATDDVLPELGHAEKVELLQHGRAFVFPIRWEEPFGLVMAEAMACGLPVLATPRGAARDLVDDGATGFLRSDIDGLSRALDDVERIDPATCRSWVAERFSSDAMVSRYERLFHRVVRHRARVRAPWTAFHARRRVRSSTVRPAPDTAGSDDRR
jgi:glycosyltransferase involved in cell wall biosynthesis